MHFTKFKRIILRPTVGLHSNNDANIYDSILVFRIGFWSFLLLSLLYRHDIMKKSSKFSTCSRIQTVNLTAFTDIVIAYSRGYHLQLRVSRRHSIQSVDSLLYSVYWMLVTLLVIILIETLHPIDGFIAIFCLWDACRSACHDTHFRQYSSLCTRKKYPGRSQRRGGTAIKVILVY